MCFGHVGLFFIRLIFDVSLVALLAREFAELLKKYPMAPRAPDSMLKLGLSLFQLGQMNEGCAALAALPAKYPQASPAITTRARNERRDAMCR